MVHTQFLQDSVCLDVVSATFLYLVFLETSGTEHRDWKLFSLGSLEDPGSSLVWDMAGHFLRSPGNPPGELYELVIAFRRVNRLPQEDGGQGSALSLDIWACRFLGRSPGLGTKEIRSRRPRMGLKADSSLLGPSNSFLWWACCSMTMVSFPFSVMVLN